MRKLIRKIVGKRVTAFVAEQVISRSIRKTVRAVHGHQGRWTAEEAIDFLFSKDAEYVTPWQHRVEILALAKEIEKQRPKVVLEIGTASGGTLFLAGCLAADDALIVSIDLPNGMYGGGYPDWKVPLYQSFARPGQRVELIRADSHTKETFEALKAILQGRTIDYLFIDGDHTYEGVKQDFERYSTLLSAKSQVAFHDIVSDKSEVPNHFVHEYWEEIKRNYTYHEFVQDPGQSKLGLGLLKIG